MVEGHPIIKVFLAFDTLNLGAKRLNVEILPLSSKLPEPMRHQYKNLSIARMIGLVKSFIYI